ncbi:MAG: TIGR03617 family F420-dependent LLM class oxidoreductase [Acidobacteriota bacterium]
MRVNTTLPQQDLNLVPEAARRLEEMGYDGVATQENRYGPFLALGVAAVSTTRLELGTGVAIAFPRSPMITASLAWDLQRASRGRFSLGLGSQVKGHIERRFSVPWSAPSPWMSEYVRSLRAIFRCWQLGERLEFEGEHYNFSLMTPNFSPEPLECDPPSITIAAVGPAMMRLAGRHGDGVRLHGFCTRKYLENVALPLIEEGMRQAPGGPRERRHFQISGGGFVATGADDETVSKQFEFVRQRVGFYGSTRAYWPVFEQHGLEELGEKLNVMSKQGQWKEMAAEVSDDVVRLFCAVGRHDEIVGAIEERFGGLCDVVGSSASTDMPGEMTPDLIQDVKQIASPFEDFSTTLQ